MLQTMNYAEFIKLSAILNYQLTSATDPTDNIMLMILGDKRLEPQGERCLHKVLHYLTHAYKDTRRRLGPLSVLHPIRATLLMSQMVNSANLLDILTELLHDKLEDIRPEKCGQQNYVELEQEFRNFLEQISEKDNWFLNERIDWLTKKDEEETYYTYIGRVMEKAKTTPELVHVKLADRLDNTFDLRLDLYDPLTQVHYYELAFQLLFVNKYNPTPLQYPHPATSVLNGAYRLYQLFKNAVLLSLIRQTKALETDSVAVPLFQKLAHESIQEAQRVMVHIFYHHYTDLSKQRERLMKVMEYCQQGGIDRITEKNPIYRLDGLFVTRFDHKKSEERKSKLGDFYQDKELMIEAAIAFIVIFQSFLNDESFFIEGIQSDGIHPPPVHTGTIECDR